MASRASTAALAADGAGASPKGEVPAVARAARLLATLADAPAPLSLTDLAGRLGLPRSSVHGLCATLVHAGLARRFADGSYHLGPRVMDLARAFLARTDLTAEFARVLDATHPLPEESMVLSVLDGGDIVYVGCRRGTRPFGFDLRIGMRLPANCAASGKALLATLPAERIAAMARAGGFYGLTARSVTRLPALRAELARVRERGYAIDDEETRQGIVCFGAPVFGSSGSEAVAAVGVSMPKAALDAAQKAGATAAVRAVAAALSARLGAGAEPAAPFTSTTTPRGTRSGRATR